MGTWASSLNPCSLAAALAAHPAPGLESVRQGRTRRDGGAVVAESAGIRSRLLAGQAIKELSQHAGIGRLAHAPWVSYRLAGAIFLLLGALPRVAAIV